MQPHWDGLIPGKMRAFAPPDKPTMPATARFPALPYCFALILGVQAFVVDFQVLDTVEHLHLFVLQAGAMNPAGGLAQAVADLGK